MKIKILEDCRIAQEPWNPQLVFKKDDSSDVPDKVGNRLIEIGKAISAESKMAGNVEENKMFTPDIENKAGELKAGELKAGDKIEVLDGNQKGLEGTVAKVDDNDILKKQLKKMSKDELVTFAKENDIKIDIRNKEDKILKAILKAT